MGFLALHGVSKTAVSLMGVPAAQEVSKRPFFIYMPFEKVFGMIGSLITFQTENGN
jgi:hypothetical protein